MRTTTLVTHPQTTDLTTRARAKAQLQVASTANDALYDTLIAGASDAIRSRLGFDPERAEVLDRFAGHGFEAVQLSRQPLVSFSAVEHDGSAVTTSDQAVFIADAGAGLLGRASGWTRSTRPLWTVQHWSGWLLPGDDVSGATVTFAVSDQSLTLASGSWPLLVAGDRVTVSGASQGANSGSFSVLSRVSATKLTLAAGSGIVDEGPTQSIAVAVRNLPRDLERAAIVMVRDAFTTGDQGLDPRVTAEQIGKLRFTYADPGALPAVSPEAESILARWARVSL